MIHQRSLWIEGIVDDLLSLMPTNFDQIKSELSYRSEEEREELKENLTKIIALINA